MDVIINDIKQELKEKEKEEGKPKCNTIAKKKKKR